MNDEELARAAEAETDRLLRENPDWPSPEACAKIAALLALPLPESPEDQDRQT